MIIGRRLFGRVDEVPGILYVATLFYHVMWLPVMPVDSFIVLQQPGSSGRSSAVKVAFNLKSAVVGYVRAYGTGAAGILLVAGFTQGQVVSIGLGILFMAVVIWMAAGFPADPARAKELVQMAGFDTALLNADARARDKLVDEENP